MKLRSTPSLQASVVTTLNGGEAVSLLETLTNDEGEWAKVQRQNATTGYVKMKFLQK